MRRGLAARIALAAACAGALAISAVAQSAPQRVTDACGLPTTGTVWIDFGQGSVKPDTRAVLARPGVVVATSGTAVPKYFRAHGAATTYFELHLSALVGQPGTPADPASVPAAADALYGKAAASTACTTPWIALNELFGSGLATPWSVTNTQYRANVLALMQGLAAHGARPVLLVNGSPNVAGDAAAWWQQVAQAGSIVYEAYFDARRAAALGSLLGNRRLRLGLRSSIGLFRSIGITPDHLGVMLGFHSGGGQGAGGRQGLQPREAWLRVVKWHALAAKQVAADTKLGSVWSWGWGTYGPTSVDPDKPAAACVYLWTRNTSLCNGPVVAGDSFHASLTEGQIFLPPGVYCAFVKRRVLTADLNRLTALTHDRHAALDALFSRVTLRSAAAVTNAEVQAVEDQAIARDFAGDRSAYLQALTDAHATLGVARSVVRDELMRQAIAAKLAAAGTVTTPYEWMTGRVSALAGTAICRQDNLPGSGDFPRDDSRWIAPVPLPSLLPFLFDDQTPPSAPQVVGAVGGTATVTVQWAYGSETDLAGYELFRAAAPDAPYIKVSKALFPLTTFLDRALPSGVPAYYVIRAVDTSGNESEPSPVISATPA